MIFIIEDKKVLKDNRSDYEKIKKLAKFKNLNFLKVKINKFDELKTLFQLYIKKRWENSMGGLIKMVD